MLRRCFSNTTHATEGCVIVTLSMRTLVIKHTRSMSPGTRLYTCWVLGRKPWVGQTWARAHEPQTLARAHQNPVTALCWWPLSVLWVLPGWQGLGGMGESSLSISLHSLPHQPYSYFPCPSQVWLFFSSSLHQEWCQASYISNESPHRCRKGIAKAWMRQVYRWTMNYYMIILITMTTKIMRTYKHLVLSRQCTISFNPATTPPR